MVEGGGYGIGASERPGGALRKEHGQYLLD
jgi:hypothetical protein